MFTHKIDPLVRKELDQLFKLASDLGAQVQAIDDSQKAIEAKLDELLASKRSIESEKPPEELAVMPGHIPWSKRKAAREAATASPTFVDKVRKGAATTKPETASEETNEN